MPAPAEDQEVSASPLEPQSLLLCSSWALGFPQPLNTMGYALPCVTLLQAEQWCLLAVRGGLH